MEMSSSSDFEQWAYGIGQSRYGRHGKTDTRRGSSVRSEGIVLTMLLCSANDISAICSIPTKNITTKLVRTYRCTRTRRSRVLSRPSVARWRSQFWADCTTNISERKFPTGTPPTVVGAAFVSLVPHALLRKHHSQSEYRDVSCADSARGLSNEKAISRKRSTARVGRCREGKQVE